MKVVIFMSLEFELPLAALMFIIILLIVYYSKPKIRLIENKMYEIILVLSSIVIIVDTYIHFLCSIVGFDVASTKYLTLLIFLNKLLAIMFVIIIGSLLCYVLIISYEKIRQNIRVIIYPFILLVIVFSVIISFLTVKLIQVGQVSNSTGSALNFAYFVIGILLAITLLLTSFNFKKIDKRYFAIFGILLVFVVFYTVQYYFPGIIFYDIALCILCYIMYFTIENPDLKMIEALNIAKSEAERANSAKSDFLASMSHEIRTPLNAIAGFSHAIMGMENLPEEAMDYARDIVKSSDTLLEIVGGVLDVSKIESNKMELVEVLYKPREEFDGLASLAKSRIGEKPIIFNYKIAEDIPYQVYGDKVNVKKIITNLLTNATKYTKEGQILFNVKCVNRDDISYFIISVQDTGVGIKEENVSKLFTKFERLDMDKNTTTEGTGLGLAITKKLVDLMGGKINVKSQYGVGSIFMVQIPQRIAMQSKPLTDTQLLSTAEIMQKKKEQELNLKGKKILIVDDNALNIKVAKVALKDFELELDEVMSGEECIARVKSGYKYDVILMDIMMPGMNGEECLVELNKIEGFNIPVIALTADAVSGAKEKYIELGFISYISKPFTKEEIRHELTKILC